jgi:hypothetical protein
MVCLRNISVNTLHKGDDDDDNKTKLIPVIIRENGTISKSFRKYLSNILAKHEIKELQKTSHIGHCTRTEESTNVKVQ